MKTNLLSILFAVEYAGGLELISKQYQDIKDLGDYNLAFEEINLRQIDPNPKKPGEITLSLNRVKVFEKIIQQIKDPTIKINSVYERFKEIKQIRDDKFTSLNLDLIFVGEVIVVELTEINTGSFIDYLINAKKIKSFSNLNFQSKDNKKNYNLSLVADTNKEKIILTLDINNIYRAQDEKKFEDLNSIKDEINGYLLDIESLDRLLSNILK